MKRTYYLVLLVFLSVISIINAQANKQLIKQVDAYLHKELKSDEPGYSIRIIKKGKVLYKKGFGLADLESNTPIQQNTVFRLGSITKQFTAIAILQLVEKKQISLQDSIQKFIPDFPSKGKTITIEHLLTHTSGIPEYLALNHPDPYVLRKDFTPKEIVDFFKNESLEFEPGSKWSYSNSGYIALGYIIELISKKTYAEYIHENLFTPSGMNHSYYDDYYKIIPNRAKGYEFIAGQYVNSEFRSTSIPYSAGALLSTTEDLFTWHQALYDEKLVSKELLQKAFTAYKLNTGEETSYGYGWFIHQENEIKTIEHSGRISGFNTTEIYIPKDDLMIIILSNIEDDGYKTRTSFHLADDIISMLRGENQKEIKIKSIVLETYKGKYQLDTDVSRIVEVKKEEDVFIIEESNQWAAQLIAKTQSIFTLKNTKPVATLEFIKDDTTSKVEKMIITQKGKQYIWNKL